MRIVAAAVLAIGVLGLGLPAGTSRSATAPSPRVIAVVGGGTLVKPLDAQMLAPIRGSWWLPVANYLAVAVSPSGSRIAVSYDEISFHVLDATTGRRLCCAGAADTSTGLYWLGGDGFGAGGEPFIVAGLSS